MSFVHKQAGQIIFSLCDFCYPTLTRRLSKKISFGLLLFFFFSWQSNAFAADEDGVSSASGVPAISAKAKPASGTPAPNDKGDWKGDSIKLANDAIKIKGPGGDNFFAPDGAIFTVTADNLETHELTVKFLNIKQTPEQKANNRVSVDNSWDWFFYGPSEKDRDVPTAQNGSVNTHDLYTLDKAAVEKMDYYRHGWAFGVLLVPYKYQLYDKSFGSALSVGPYLGYRQEDRGSSVTYVVSAGLVNNIPVPLADNTGTVNRSGFSIAAGGILSIDKGSGIQVGVLVGQDRLGKNAAATYVYEGKTWVSVAVGYKFF